MKRLFKNLLLSAWRTLLPKRARNSLRLWLMLDVPDLSPRLIEQFNAGPVLVLAPHMDDEIIGPGGTILRHVQANVPVTFVYVTDGMTGGPPTNPPLNEVRKAESRKAAEIVGVRDLIFLDGPDGSLHDSPAIVAALVKILTERKPAIIYAPALTDHHADHWATNRILRKSIDALPADLCRNLLIRGYEVWTPLPANRMADITQTADAKHKAIEAFVSQTRLLNYSRTILGLNQYRSMRHLHGQGYAEAFLETTPDEYRRLFDGISLKTPVREQKGS
ncbi:MAG: PIG-L deacetylase family protein [Tepidisphaeraceae bacterium]|jgi:LmbE family N-acetylglucosaminyl deacetylase